MDAGQRLRLWAVTVFAISVTQPASASKPWDIARFASCVRHIGGVMDPDEIVTTAACGEYDAVEKSEGDELDVTLDKSVMYSRTKATSSQWLGGLRFAIQYSRASTVAGGNAFGGYASFHKMTILWPTGLQEIALSTASQKNNGCSAIGRGLLSMTRCGYEELIYAVLTPELTEQFHRVAMSGDPRLRVKFFAEDGASFETWLSAAEVEAAAQATSR